MTQEKNKFISRSMYERSSGNKMNSTVTLYWLLSFLPLRVLNLLNKETEHGNKKKSEHYKYMSLVYWSLIKSDRKDELGLHTYALILKDLGSK